MMLQAGTTMLKGVERKAEERQAKHDSESWKGAKERR